jgi:hypothetical protein
MIVRPYHFAVNIKQLNIRNRIFYILHSTFYIDIFVCRVREQRHAILQPVLDADISGMGRDGAAQITEMRKKGAWTLGQNKETSIVYGMPKVAFEMGGVQKQVALADMAGEISRLAKEHQFA